MANECKINYCSTNSAGESEMRGNLAMEHVLVDNRLSARKLQNRLIKVSGDGEGNYVYSSALWFVEQQAALKKQFK